MSCYDEAVKAKDWLNQNAFATSGNNAFTVVWEFGFPHPKHCLNDAELIAFAREKGFEGEG